VRAACKGQNTVPAMETPDLVTDLRRGESGRATPRLSVVLCGSFRRDVGGLADVYAALGRSFRVISPSSLEFVDREAAFVRLPGEAQLSDSQIEAKHLAAITGTDFVWLHAPEGYVGLSAALEIGHASALGIPIFARAAPAEPVLAGLVSLVASPLEVTRELLAAVERPGAGVARLQYYYGSASTRRAWDHESAEDTLALLAGELAELKTAVGKRSAGIRPEDDRDADAGGEIADMQLYLVHLANVLDISVAEAISVKERLNARRFDVERPTADELQAGALDEFLGEWESEHGPLSPEELNAAEERLS
jgi:NTP pyrophosphatase (non-canonical NTP hydrolase)